ncbi:MAG: AEC family transporter [Treponema sp.]|nr:AEC family transporter [Treponema sp.]
MFEIFNLVFTDPNFLSAFSQTIIIIALGFLFMRKGIVDISAKKTLTALIWKLAVPCFAFNAFMQDFEWNSFKASLTEFLLAVIFYIVLIIIGKLIFLKKGKDFSTVSGFMIAIGQTTLFSMPILQSVYENKAQEVMLYISTISIVFRIFVYIVATTVISGEKITLKKLGPQLKKVFITPVMIGMFLGILVFVSQNKVPFLRIDKSLPVLYVTVKALARMVGPLCMLLIGMSIGEAKITECLKDGFAWLLAVLRNLIAPVIILCICFLMHKTGIYHFNEYSLMAIVVGFSAPISVTLSIACMQYGKEEVLASRACVISTLLTLLTFPLSFVMVHLALQWM